MKLLPFPVSTIMKTHDKTKAASLKNQAIKKSYEAKLKPMSSKAYRIMLEKSEEDYKQDRLISQKTLERKSGDW